MNENQLKDYFIFLDMLNQKLAKFFAQQKDYIFCKEGCAHCCKDGEYPCTDMEFSFLKIGFNELDEETKKIVIQKTLELKKEKDKNPDKILQCECPFLVNDKCSVYFYRPVICRTFGIPYYTEDDKLKVPFCRNLGLNYSMVYDEETKVFSQEKFEALGFEQEPLAYNLSQKFIINTIGRNAMKLDFGKQSTITDQMIDMLK